MSFQRDIRKAIESGSISFAVVEANNNGFITVQLIGSTSRITNLEFIGSTAPQAGDKVILDYSAGNRPVVRPVEGQTLIGLLNYNYMGEDANYYQMENPDDYPDPTSILEMGGIDVGMGCTVNANGYQFPNEPQDPFDNWVQYWGYNVPGGYQSIVYDTMSIYGIPVVVGTQQFNIQISGKYLLTFHSSLHIAGLSGSDPHGTFSVFCNRTLGYGPFPIMTGTATAAGYNQYYNIDISKLIYLPEGEILEFEMMYTGDVIGYFMKNSTNPLKWLTEGNELIFKIQLIAETYIDEPAPEVIEFEGLARRTGSWGTTIEQDMDTATKELTAFSLECHEASTNPNSYGSPISDNEFLYAITNDQIYGSYQMWKIDPEDGASLLIQVADGSNLEAAFRYVLVDTGVVGYTWYQLFSWTSDPDDTAMTISYRYMDWNEGETENEIVEIETFDVPWAPPIGAYDYVWGSTNKGVTNYLTVTPFATQGNVAFHNDKGYMIAMAVYCVRTVGWSYYSQGLKWRIYDVAGASYVDVTHSWTTESYQVVTNTGWFQYDNKLYTFVRRSYGFGWLQAMEVHIIDLMSMTLEVHDIKADIQGTYTGLSGATFDYTRGRMYAMEREAVIHAPPIGNRLVYWNVSTNTLVAIDESDDYFGLATNRYNVYADPLDGSYPDWVYYNCANSSIEIDAEGGANNTFICTQVSSDEDRIWILDMTIGERKLVGYHATQDPRELSLENTAIGSLDDVSWVGWVNLIGNAFIICVKHSTLGTHWYIIKPRI